MYPVARMVSFFLYLIACMLLVAGIAVWFVVKTPVDLGYLWDSEDLTAAKRQEVLDLQYKYLRAGISFGCVFVALIIMLFCDLVKAVINTARDTNAIRDFLSKFQYALPCVPTDGKLLDKKDNNEPPRRITVNLEFVVRLIHIVGLLTAGFSGLFIWINFHYTNKDSVYEHYWHHWLIGGIVAGWAFMLALFPFLGLGRLFSYLDRHAATEGFTPKKYKQLKLIAGFLVGATVVVVGLGLWWLTAVRFEASPTKPKGVNDSLHQKILAYVELVPDLRPAYDRAMLDDLLTLEEARAIMNEAKSLAQQGKASTPLEIQEKGHAEPPS